VATIAVAGVAATSREETATLGQLGAIVAGIAARPVAPSIVYVGEMARDDLEPAGSAETDDGAVFAPGPEVGEPEGDPLRDLLDRLDPSGPNPRRAALEALLDLAVVLDRRIELVEVGFDGGLRAVAGPGGLEVPAAFVPIAGLVPTDLDDDAVDEVLAWSTIALDRHRMRDRLRELRLSPWVEAHGDGARLRTAAARAAVARLVRATPWIEALSAPDLIVVAGGAWAAAPGPAICLAIADVIRRPGASQLAFDHARLLGPLGTIADPVERRALIGELADDLLAPLGSIIVPQGLQAGRTAGRLTVIGSAGESGLDLIPGGLHQVDLPPGQVATVDLRASRDPVSLGTRGRRMTFEVGGGLGGVLVDLRDIPLRLPDRAGRAGRCSRRGRRRSGRVTTGDGARDRRSPSDRRARLVPARRLLERAPIARFELSPGDRILVAAGDIVSAGFGLAERQRDPGRRRPAAGRTGGDRQPAAPRRGLVAGRRPRGRWAPPPASAADPGRRLLHPADGRWRIAAGGHVDRLEAPAAGTVVEAIPGRGLTLRLAGTALLGTSAVRIPARGRVERSPAIGAARRARCRTGGGDPRRRRSDRLGAIIRARATGVRGVVASGLARQGPARPRIEARQRASLQPLAPFAVLILDGTVRRPIAGPVAAWFAALEGREVAIVVDPPMVVFDPPTPEPAPPPETWVRIQAGALAGREGRWLRSAGLRRFAAGVHLESASIALDDGSVADVPLADLERFV
jgi:hypothetical protein